MTSHLPYKRPAQDGKPTGMYYQPSAAAYQQLIQLQSAQQSYVPVSCEYISDSCSNHALANNTIYPLNTSTATSNANNLHHHPNLYSQTSINACTINNNNNVTPNYQLTIPSNNNNNNTIRKHDNHLYHSNINNQNNCNNLIENFNLENHASNNNNNPITSTFFADADAQINTTQPTAHQNSIIQSSPSKVTTISSSTIIDKNAAMIANCNAAVATDDGDSENNALTVQIAKNSLNAANGLDVSNSSSCLPSTPSTSSEENNNKSKSINDMPNGANLVNNNNVSNSNVDDAATTTTTTTSVQSTIDESNLNAISFNSATSSSPAASMSAIYTTSSITINNNNNNSILSRKNSLTTPSQPLINSSSSLNYSSSKTPSNITTNGKVDSLSDYINPSSFNNPTQAALLSAVLYNQPYQQLALTPNLYSDPAQLAKEMAQKNYANALKYAVAQAPSAATAYGGKTTQMNPLTASYSGVALSAANNNALLQAAGTSNSSQRLTAASMNPSTRAAFMQNFSRPIQNPFQQFIRPQLQMNQISANANAVAAQNQYYAAAAHQQFLNQQNYYYSGLTNQMQMAGNPQLPHMTATSVASSSSPFASAASSYPFAAYGQAQAFSAQSMPTHMMQMPQMTSQPQQSQTGSTSAVVLNPYKKMKTS